MKPTTTTGARTPGAATATPMPGPNPVLGYLAAAIGLLRQRSASGPQTTHARLDSSKLAPRTNDPIVGERDRVQFERLAGVIQAAAGRGANAGRCHARAAQRIDAALYELDRLREELCGVIAASALAPAPGAASRNAAIDTSRQTIAAEAAVTVDRARAARSAA